jgi:phytoene synthase
VREQAVLLYAYCRRVDDAIDCVPAAEQPSALSALRAELEGVYGALPLRDPLLVAMRALVRAREIPRQYLEELLLGMEMDVQGARYPNVPQLLRYCHRVAGVVGLMMCHAMGVRRSRALLHAAHLGIAMQLTNIARDVLEDWERGRLYLPADLLARHGAPRLETALGGRLPPSGVPAVAAALVELLELADEYYRSGEAGLRELSLRCAFGVRVARAVYSEIGAVLRARACDPLVGRAVVGTGRKLWLVACALVSTLASVPFTRWRSRVHTPSEQLELRDAVARPKGQP